MPFNDAVGALSQGVSPLSFNPLSRLSKKKASAWVLLIFGIFFPVI